MKVIDVKITQSDSYYAATVTVISDGRRMSNQHSSEATAADAVKEAIKKITHQLTNELVAQVVITTTATIKA